MKILIASLMFICAIAFTGCVPTNKLPPQSALEIREMQTRNFQVSDERLVMKAVLNALQDDGYITKNAVSDLGLLTATKEVDTEDSTRRVIDQIFMGENARWEKTSVIEANANVSEFGREVRLRISFQRKLLDNVGNVISVENIGDPLFYQQFFTKVDQSIFIQKQRI